MEKWELLLSATFQVGETSIDDQITIDGQPSYLARRAIHREHREVSPEPSGRGVQTYGSKS